MCYQTVSVYTWGGLRGDAKLLQQAELVAQPCDVLHAHVACHSCAHFACAARRKGCFDLYGEPGLKDGIPDGQGGE